MKRFLAAVAAFACLLAAPFATAQTTYVHAGRLVDVQAGRVLTDQRITIDGERITAVALSLGYASPGAFAQMFRRELGTSPTGYRQR